MAETKREGDSGSPSGSQDEVRDEMAGGMSPDHAARAARLRADLNSPAVLAVGSAPAPDLFRISRGVVDRLVDGPAGSAQCTGEMTDGLAADGTAYIDPTRERDLVEADEERRRQERTAIKTETSTDGRMTSVSHVDAEGHRVEIVVMQVGEHDFHTPKMETEVISVLDGKLRQKDGSLGAKVYKGIWFAAGSKYTLIAETPVELRRVFKPAEGTK